jgi:uncharacterized DUF497 family protein
VVVQYPAKDDTVFRIREVIVSPQQEEHIWSKHQVTPEEVEEACFGAPLVLRGRDRSYAVYGRTDAGRYLAVFLYPRGPGRYSLATAREMTEVERRRYQRSER